MGGSPTSNPYRAPLARPEAIDGAPSLARLVAFRLFAAFLVLVALVLALALLKVALRDPLRLASTGTIGILGAIAFAGAGARVLWIRAVLTSEEARKLDEAADLRALEAIARHHPVATAHPHDFGSYEAKSSAELLQVYEHINPDKAGARYEQLLNTIRARVAASEHRAP